MRSALDLIPIWARARRDRRRRRNAALSQWWTLRRLLARAENTDFGRQHGFAAIQDVADFQSRVPLRRYEDFWNDWWRADFPRIAGRTWPDPVPYFALSSGTTAGASKYIPYTAAMARANISASLDVLSSAVAEAGSGAMLGGRIFMLGGSTTLQDLGHGAKAGDLSGIAVAERPWWTGHWQFPPTDIALMGDWEAKIDRLVPLIPRTDIRILAGTPSWLLLLFERLLQAHPGPTLRHVMPKLSLIIHGAVPFPPYRDRFETLLAGMGTAFLEVYPASEGFIGFQDDPHSTALSLISDGALFFEFVPLAEIDRPNPTRHWIANAQAGIEYAVVLSNAAGLWAYVIGDTIRFDSVEPPRLHITGRLGWFLSAFGEHLSGAELDAGITAGAQAAGTTIADYATFAHIPQGETARGRHQFLVEPSPPLTPDQQRLFTERLDATLVSGNDDYAARRAGDFGLDPPEISILAPGTFAAWMKQRGKLGGQNKVPRVLPKPEMVEEILATSRKIAAGAFP